MFLTVLRWILSHGQNRGGKSCNNYATLVSSQSLFRADCQIWQIEPNCTEASVRQTNVGHPLRWDHQTQFSCAFPLIYARGLCGEYLTTVNSVNWRLWTKSLGKAQPSKRTISLCMGGWGVGGELHSFAADAGCGGAGHAITPWGCIQGQSKCYCF